MRFPDFIVQKANSAVLEKLKEADYAGEQFYKTVFQPHLEHGQLILLASRLRAYFSPLEFGVPVRLG